MTLDARLDELVRRQRAARAMGDADRLAAIAAAGNVVGFERFAQRLRGGEHLAHYPELRS